MRSRDSQPDAVAIRDGERQLTFSEVHDQAASLASSLGQLGVKRQDRVVVQLPNRVEGLVAYLGVTRLGAVMIPQSTIYREEDLAYVLDTTEANVLIAARSYGGFDVGEMALALRSRCPSLDEIVLVGESIGHHPSFDDLLTTPPYDGALPDADDLHVILFTSGTTARPKACVHTSSTFLFAVRVIADAHGVGPGDTMFMPSPITHTTGLVCGLAGPTLRGYPTVLQDVWDPHAALAAISKWGCTASVGATTFLQTMTVAYDPVVHDVSRFRLYATGGAPIPSIVVEEAARRLGCTVMTMFGQSESQPCTFTRLDDPIERIAASDGRAAPGVDVAILGDDGCELPHGCEGEICARSPGRMVCYWGDDDATRMTIDSAGWCHSGDLGRMDDAGYIRVTGRKKDIIVRGGLNLSAAEIESYVLKHPQVIDVAVVGLPDDRLGERAAAFVVLSEGASLQLGDVTGFMSSMGIAIQKLPERLEVIDRLPRTLTGKVKKYELRDMVTG